MRRQKTRVTRNPDISASLIKKAIFMLSLRMTSITGVVCGVGGRGEPPRFRRWTFERRKIPKKAAILSLWRGISGRSEESRRRGSPIDRLQSIVPIVRDYLIEGFLDVNFQRACDNVVSKDSLQRVGLTSAVNSRQRWEPIAWVHSLEDCSDSSSWTESDTLWDVEKPNAPSFCCAIAESFSE